MCRYPRAAMARLAEGLVQNGKEDDQQEEGADLAGDQPGLRWSPPALRSTLELPQSQVAQDDGEGTGHHHEAARNAEDKRGDG